MANFVRSGSLGSDLKGLRFTGETIEVDRADEEWAVAWTCPTCQGMFTTTYWALGNRRANMHMHDYLRSLMDPQHKAAGACTGMKRLIANRPGVRTGRWMDGKGRIHAD